MDDFILEIEDAIPKDLCREIIKGFEIDPRKYTARTVGGISNVKRGTDLQIACLPEWENVTEKLGDILVDNFEIKYRDFIEKNIPSSNQWWTSGMLPRLKSHTGFQIQRIRKGEYYKWHMDHHLEEKRTIGYIYYLNTLDEEDDGATEFHNGRRIKPKEGKLLLFPSTWTYVHQGREVKGKTKYIITGWITEEVDMSKIKIIS
jgi:hypothetical protein